MKPEVDPKNLFLEISVLLTGFNKAELYATGMFDTYYHALQANTGQANFAYFFEEVEKILLENRNETEKINQADKFQTHATFIV